MAFQEQDHVVSACAASALWSVFHGTGIIFHHTIPSPVEITEFATKHLPIKTRTIPNDGLNIEQMTHAIKCVNLEPFLVNVIKDIPETNIYLLKSTVYSYLKGKIPLIMGIRLYDTTNNEFIGYHAVAVTGFNLDIANTKAKPYGSTNFTLISSRIDKLYVHDDQI